MLCGMSTQRSTSFGAVADDYDRYRPGPAPAVLDWLLRPEFADVLDVGAGTGALTRLVVAWGARVTAVEPDARMRATLTDHVPAATTLAGTAERLPVADASQDAVLAHSAWHWTDPAAAVAEAARVLRPGGRLGVLWTRLDRDVDWVDGLARRLRPATGDGSGIGGLAGGPRRRRLQLPADAPFAPVDGPHVVHFTRPFTRAELLGLAGTYSAVIVLPPSERAALLERVRRDLESHPLLAGDDDSVEVPMVSQCWRADRR
jgi:SAM-dependent methyltransferase